MSGPDGYIEVVILKNVSRRSRLYIRLKYKDMVPVLFKVVCSIFVKLNYILKTLIHRN